MPIKTDSLQRKLCNLLNVRGYKPEPKNSEGKTSPTPEDADVIKFTFSQDGNAIDSVWVTIDSSHSLVVYYDDAVMREGNTKTPGLQYDDSWTGLLKQLKNWAQRRQLSFELKNKDHLASDMAQRTSMKKKEQVSEGYYPIGNKASYSDAVPNVKIILQHTRKIEEGEKRYRNISKIFVENTLGERFAVPTTKPGIARVYARHVAEGGSPYDTRGTHITSIVEEYTKMAGFVRATKNNQFNESTQQLIAEGINHYQSLRESLHKMTGHRGYNAYFESWTPTLNEETDDESSLGEMFVQETLDPRIESVMPILSKLQKKISEMKEVTSLEDWADDLIGEATDLKTIPENLGPEQKRVGQLGPTEKVGKKGTIGKLVGANESVGEEVDEGWKQKLGAAALAGSMAMGANARVVPGQDEPGVNRLTGKPNIAQVAATDPVPDSAETEKPILKGFSASYLQKAADPNRFGRFMISVEDAKAELDRRAAAWERRSQGDQKINEGFLDEMHADLEELSEKEFKDEYNMTKAEANEKYGSTGSWLNEQGVAEGLDEAVGGNYLYHATSTAGLKGMLSSGNIQPAAGPQMATKAQTRMPTVSTTRDWGYASGATGNNLVNGAARDAVLVLDRNAIESNFKTLSTSQSERIKGQAFNPYLKKDGVARSQNTDVMARANIKGKEKYAEPTAKAGGEFEEAVVVPKGALPLKGTMVGFWVNPRSELLMKDPTIINDPRRLDMVKPNQFVKANQKQGVAEGSSSLDEYKRRLASIQSLRYDDPPEYAKKYSEILRLFPKEHHLYATGVQKGSYSPGERGSGTGRIGRVSEDEEMTQQKKEQVVTVKHKDSGKELRIVKTAVPDYQKRGYYPVKKQEGVAEGSVLDTDTTGYTKYDMDFVNNEINQIKKIQAKLLKIPGFTRKVNDKTSQLQLAEKIFNLMKRGHTFDGALVLAQKNPSQQGVAEGDEPGYVKYEQMKDKISSVLIKLYKQGKDAETIKQMGGRVAKHLGYDPTDSIYQDAWLTSFNDASLDGSLDQDSDDDYTDYSMRQGERGNPGRFKEQGVAEGSDINSQQAWMPTMIGAKAFHNIPRSLEAWANSMGIERDIAIRHNPDGNIWTIAGKIKSRGNDTVYTYQWRYDSSTNQFYPHGRTGMAEATGDKRFDDMMGKIKAGATPNTPKRFIKDIKKVAKIKYKFQVGDWVTIDPNETAKWPTSGMIGRISRFSSDGDAVVNVNPGGGASGGGSSGTHTSVPTSMLEKLAVNLDEPGVAEGSNPEKVEVRFSAKEYAAMSPAQKAAKQEEWQQLKQQAKKRMQNFTLIDTDKEQGVTESSDADQFENWKAAVRKQYPNEAGQIKFKGKGFGDSIVAEIPGRDQAFGEFNMGTGEAWVAPLDESQTMVREAQDELEAMLRIIRK